MAIAPPRVTERRRLRITGVVQGVGFRPFVYGLASRHSVAGFVLNDGGGVLIEAEGGAGALDEFATAIAEESPALARVDTITVDPIEARGDHRFRIERSAGGEPTALVPADVATCGQCLGELFDPADRRHRYPFINCTQCGPRFTIVESVPYDRPNTTMARFEMCEACRAEYEDPGDRRFHAEPIACPDCGPRLSLVPPSGSGVSGEHALAAAVSLLRAGRIVAVKGLGGYHLACDASSEPTVARLRERKHREQKPLAVMAERPGPLAVLEPDELELLESRERPIVVARRDPNARTGAVDRPREPLGRADAPLHPASPPALRRLRRAPGDDQRKPLRRADRDRRRRRPQAAQRDRRRLPHPRPSHPSPLRGLGRPLPLPDPPLARIRSGLGAVAGGGPGAPGRDRRRAEEHLLRGPRPRGVPLAAPRRPRLGGRLPCLPHRPGALPADARRSSPS